MTERSPTEIIVTQEMEGKTVASLVREATNLSWNKARDLCKTGRVRWNRGERLDGAERVRAGDRIEVLVDGPKRTSGVLPKEDLIHVDRDVVVVCKPAGVLTLPFEETDRDTLVDRTRAALRRWQKGTQHAEFDPMLGVVHRLDKDTTGVMVFARTLAAKRALEKQFRAHSIERVYVAIVHGDFEDASYTTWIVQNRGDGLRGSWGYWRPTRSDPPAEAQRSVTHARLLERLQGASLVECRLETGRQHQIRIHLSEAGHALVGEKVYIRDHAGPTIAAPRPMLHARALGFIHPRTQKAMHFESAPPPDFQEQLAKLRG